MANDIRSSQNSRSGASLVELLSTLVIVVPLVLLAIDLGMIYAGVSLNDKVCRSAARSAASGPPSAVSSGTPQNRADSTIAGYAKGPSAFYLHPHALISEDVIQPLPKLPLGGPVDGKVSVETIIDIHPMFLLAGLAGNDGFSFRSTHTFPYTYVVPGAENTVEIRPPADMWEVTMSTSLLDRYLDYPGSTLKPVEGVSIAYVKEDRKQVSGTDAPCLYENLYYGNYQVIGCHRFHSLDLMTGSEGLIRVLSASSSSMDSYQGYATANAIVSVSLDLYLRNCPVTSVVVPLDSFDVIVDGFHRDGYLARESLESDESSSGSIFLQIVSEPPGQRTRVVL